MKRVFWAALALVCLRCLPVLATPVWRWSNPTPHGATIFAMAARGSAVVQVGEFGQAFASEDLVEWVPLKTGVRNTLRSAIWFGPRLVVTGSDGLILYSDGLGKFNQVNLGTPDWIEGVAASTNRLVAVGDNGAIYTSANGAAWERLANAEEWLRSVAYGNGIFVAVGVGGFVTRSIDGVNWTTPSRPTSQDLNRVVWLNDRFWLVGNGGVAMTSANGSSWGSILTETGNDLLNAASDGNEVVLVGRSELRTSSPPYLLWTPQIGDSPAPPDWTYYTAIWDGAEFLVGGRSGMFVEGFATNSASSTSWYSSTEAPRNWIWSLTRAGEIYAACGEAGGIFTSTDGFRFDQELVPDTVLDEIFEGIGGTTNLLVCVGTSGTILWSPGGSTNVVSTNSSGNVVTNEVPLLGIYWNEVKPHPTSNELQGVGYFNSIYIVTGGQGTILTSTDGEQWANASVAGATQMLSSVAASPTRAVIVGDFGRVLSSDNGTDWTPRDSGVTNWIYNVRFGGGQYVAVGEAGLVLTSADGITWTRRASGTTKWLNAVCFQDGKYFASGTGGVLLRSLDGVSWSLLPGSTSKSLYGIVGGGGRVLSAGLEGAILRARVAPWTTSVDFLSTTLENDGQVTLFSGQLDQQFLLQRTTDFKTWLDVRELELFDNSGALLFIDSIARGNQWFFRTVTIDP